MTGGAGYRQRRYGRLAAANVAVLALIVVLLFPIYWMLVTASVPSHIVLSRQPPLLPQWSDMSLAAFAGVLGRRPVGTWLVNSLAVACASVALSLVIATLAGYSLSRFRSRAQEASGLTLLVSRPRRYR